MKKVLFPLIVIVMTLLGYFSHKVLPGSPKAPQDHNVHLSKELLISRFISDKIQQTEENVKNSIIAAGKDISNDREFILTYFVEKAVASGRIKDITKRYATLLNLQYLTLRDQSTGVISQIGDTPEHENELPFDSLSIVVDNDKQAHIIFQSKLSVGEGALSLQGGISLDKEFLLHLSEITETTMLLTYNEEVILGTNSAPINTIGNVNNEYIVINGEKHKALFSPLTEKITLIAIFNKDNVSNL